MSAVIETRGFTKTYGGTRGIRNVDLRVEEVEVFGFLGPNGAGKTTTIRTLLGFMRPTGGVAEVFGRDVRRESVAIREKVGNLPGEFAFGERVTGEQLLRYFARLRGVRSLCHAYDLADRLGADLRRPVRKLSRGNKQKIGLVQAMFHRPPLLILDEPTGGLAPCSGRVPQDSLRGKERRPDGILLLARALGGREGLRQGRDHPRRGTGRRGTDREAGEQIFPARRPELLGEGRPRNLSPSRYPAS
ncbi:ABC transporter ATP-binding protein [Rubrobacter indicoceani]|uniref:ABC transporter ATP-binding protein n=1 Tax=Rubrobacter indicoceani TaxID=2051957 RepID=UPI001969665F|nr:ABC transporter ATP-binding protein [Rubrobacter indicoceani]